MRRPRRHVQRAMEQALKPRQADVLRQLYGLDGQGARRPSEVARAVGVTRARIGQVRAPLPPLPPGADHATPEGCTTPAAASAQAAGRFRPAGWRCWRPALVSKLRLRAWVWPRCSACDLSDIACADSSVRSFRWWRKVAVDVRWTMQVEREALAKLRKDPALLSSAAELLSEDASK